MGLLDLPAPLLAWLDGLLTELPAFARVALWGVVAGIATMWLYRAISPQTRIAEGKHEQAAQKARLDAFDGELRDAWPVIRRLLRLSLAQVGRVFGPAMLASLPVLCVLVWLSNSYGHEFPLNDDVKVQPTPAALEAHWLPGERAPALVRITDTNGQTSGEVPVPAPVTVIERWQWWNVLVGNPAGYLDSTGPLQRLEIRLPRQHLLDVGPAWLRGWEFPFFTSLLVTSLLLKRVLRIH